jgi:hypothetical protein
MRVHDYLDVHERDVKEKCIFAQKGTEIYETHKYRAAGSRLM